MSKFEPGEIVRRLRPAPRAACLITGEQMRAARALVRIEQTELARRSGVSLETIKRLERVRGPVEAHARTLRALLATFEGLGVQLVSAGDVVGVQFRAQRQSPAERQSAGAAEKSSVL